MAKIDQQLNFQYSGTVSASKSLFNRALVIQSFFPELLIIGESSCDDVLAMKRAIKNFTNKEEIFCDLAGTVLRFMALRVSREPGEYKLTGDQRLLERPHEELRKIADQLGFKVTLNKKQLLIESNGWLNPHSALKLTSEKTSQFISGLLLSSWNLPFDLELEIDTNNISESYLDMTIKFISQISSLIEIKNKKSLIIKKNSKLTKSKLEIMADSSSAISLAVLAALSGKVEITNFDSENLQPDSNFIGLLNKMGVVTVLNNNRLVVTKSDNLKPIEVNISNNPDLFPVLCVLCAHAEGKSVIHGAPHLTYKESDRISKASEILKNLAIKHEIRPDGMTIYGQNSIDKKVFSLNPDKDHRIAMAAGILMKLGHEIQLQDKHVVNKSFPEFWKIIGIEK